MWEWMAILGSMSRSGLVGLLHAVSNGGARRHNADGSVMEFPLKESFPLKPSAGAGLLYNSQALENPPEFAAPKGDIEAFGQMNITDITTFASQKRRSGIYRS